MPTRRWPTSSLEKLIPWVAPQAEQRALQCATLRHKLVQTMDHTRVWSSRSGEGLSALPYACSSPMWKLARSPCSS